MSKIPTFDISGFIDSCATKEVPVSEHIPAAFGRREHAAADRLLVGVLCG